MRSRFLLVSLTVLAGLGACALTGEGERLGKRQENIWDGFGVDPGVYSKGGVVRIRAISASGSTLFWRQN